MNSDSHQSFLKKILPYICSSNLMLKLQSSTPGSYILTNRILVIEYHWVRSPWIAQPSHWVFSLTYLHVLPLFILIIKSVYSQLKSSSHFLHSVESRTGLEPRNLKCIETVVQLNRVAGAIRVFCNHCHLLSWCKFLKI